MKICPKCQKQNDDSAAFCTACGCPLDAQGAAQQNPNAGFNPQYQGYAPAYDPYDHTAEFDPRDISENKVIAMAVYLMGWIGIIIALLGSHSSPYAAFHVRQALKITVVETLVGICALVLFWTIIVPVAAVIAMLVLLVVNIICFFQVCAGKAKEPAILRNLSFLR